MTADGSIIIDTRIDTKGVEDGGRQIEKTMNKTLGVVKKVGAAIAAVFAIRQIVQFSQECIALGSDLEEVQNVVDVTFGNMSGVINDWAKNAATQFGLSELSAKQYTSTIGAMIKSMGFAGEEVTDMSIKMAGLAGDMASFYNLDTDTAFNKIRAGIAGETEPLKQLGINLSEANLEQYRLSQGMDTAYKQMSQQQKALLRYNYLLSVTSDAQGDFARTSDSWANQLRVVKLQLDSIKASIGAGLINLLTPVLKVINSVIAGIAKMASAFKAFTELLTGKKAESPAQSNVQQMSDDYESAADSAEDYADATDKTAKATKKANKQNDKYLSGLDEIHRYQKDTADTTPKSTKSTPSSTTPSTAVDFGSLAQGNTVLDTTSEKVEKLFNLIKQGVKPTVDALKNLWDNGLKKLGEFAWTALRDFYDHFLVPVGKWVLGEGIPRFVNALNDGLMKVNWDRINEGLRDLWDQLAPFAIKVGEGLLWLWENVLVPLRTWTMNEVVPRFLTMLSTALSAVNAIIDAAQPGFQWFWDNILLPIAKWTGGVFLTIWDGINAALKTFAQWCKDNPKVIENATTFIAAFFAALTGIAIVKNIMGVVSSIGSFITIVKGVIAALNPWTLAIAAVVAAGVLLWKNWDTISAKAKEIWGGISKYFKDLFGKLKTEFSNFITAIKGVVEKGWNAIKTATSTVWNGLKTTLTTLWNGLKTAGTTVFNGLKTAIEGVWNNIKTTATSVWSGLTGTLGGFFSSIATKAGDMGGKIFSAIKGAFEKAANVIKTPINGIIGLMNGLIRGLVMGLNLAIGALNKIQVTVPRWVPVYGGKKFGFNLATITAPQIPYLATGAVIPPNAPFTAVLGDQKQGTNIETPEKLMRKIFREEMQRSNSKYEFKAMINRRVLFDEIITEGRMRQQMSASNPFELA